MFVSVSCARTFLLLNLVSSGSLGADCSWQINGIPRISAPSLTQELFREMASLPFVITDLLDGFPGMNWTLDDISAKCPKASITAAKFDPEANNWGWLDTKTGIKTTLEKFAKRYAQDVDRGSAEDASNESAWQQRLYGLDFSVHLCPAVMRDFHVPSFFSECLLQRHLPFPISAWPTLFFGAPGTRSELHYDTFNLPFWMMLFRGRKRWRAIPVEGNEHLAEPPGAVSSDGEVDLVLKGVPGRRGYLHSRLLPNYMRGEAYMFESFRNPQPDFASYPRLCEAAVYETTLEAGEVIYIPEGAAHAALNLDATIALTSNYLDADNGLMVEWLNSTCRFSPERLFPLARYHESNARFVEERCSEMLRHSEAYRASTRERRQKTVMEMQGAETEAAWCEGRLGSVCKTDMMDFGFRKAAIPTKADWEFCKVHWPSKKAKRIRKCMRRVTDTLRKYMEREDSSEL